MVSNDENGSIIHLASQQDYDAKEKKNPLVMKTKGFLCLPRDPVIPNWPMWDQDVRFLQMLF